MVKISPSILASDFTKLGQDISSVESAGAEMLHLDVMDGLFVPNISFGIPIISSMGAGGKTDPTRFRISDIYKTSVCPLARVMRTELKNRGLKKLKVIFSDEPPIKAIVQGESGVPTTRNAPGRIATVPSVAGLIIAAEVIADLCK